MAHIEELLRQRLTSDTGVAELVGNRVYPDMLPQTVAYPAVRYSLVSKVDVLARPAATGDPGEQLQILRCRMQLDLYAKSYGGAKNLASAIRAAVRGWRDNANGVIGARVADENDEQDAEEAMHRLSMDVTITYNE